MKKNRNSIYKSRCINYCCIFVQPLFYTCIHRFKVLDSEKLVLDIHKHNRGTKSQCGTTFSQKRQSGTGNVAGSSNTNLNPAQSTTSP